MLLPRSCPKRGTSSAKHTVAIGRDNSNTRHHLGRMTRRTKAVAHCEDLFNATIKLWFYLTQPHVFPAYQEKTLSIFR
ncbi:hypothetical protein [Methyloglobulus sp.]|uniref:hypothetical protein n=1 Tax=Methyloglobulus sp. TaxID=2518622 RepID=UPI003989FC0C